MHGFFMYAVTDVIGHIWLSNHRWPYKNRKKFQSSRQLIFFKTYDISQLFACHTRMLIETYISDLNL